MTTIDERVAAYRKSMSQREFESLSKYFEYLCNTYHKSISRYIAISKDEFHVEYQCVLLRALTKYEFANAKSEFNTFERYFTSAMRRFAQTIKRTHARRRYGLKPIKMISLDPHRHDMVDERRNYEIDDFEMKDLINNTVGNRNDRKIAVLKLMGQNSQEITKILAMTSHEYKLRCKSLRDNTRLFRNLLT